MLTDLGLSSAVGTTATISTYFTRLTVNGRHRLIRKANADAHHLHQLVMTGFHGHLPIGTDSPRDALAVLFAATRSAPDPGGVRNLMGLLVQSRVEPDWQSLQDSEAVRVDYVGLREYTFTRGDLVQITTVVNPTRKASVFGRRHAVGLTRSKPIALTDANDARDWMYRAMDRSGCSVEADGFWLGETREVLAPSVGGQFRLVLRPFRFHAVVNEPAVFAAAVLDGLGRGKSYGAGLLHVQIE